MTNFVRLLGVASISLFCHFSVATTPSSFRPHTSCIDAGDTQWVKAKPYSTKSWISSIIPVHNREKGALKSVRGHFSVDEDGIATPVAVTSSAGISWERFGTEKIDGWVYGKFKLGPKNSDAVNHVTGDEVAYIYPDMRTALVGQFVDKKMVSARATKITHTRCHKGILELRFAPPEATRAFARNAVYKYEQATETSATSQPTLMDPLDHRNVFVGMSRLNDTGNGMFARRTILPNELVVNYAGMVVYEEGDLYTDNMTAFEMEDAHKNLMSYNDDYMINVPPKHTSVLHYRASLGHKANHKFLEPNVDFDFFTSPRFGGIRCLRSIKLIRKGEEIFVNYNYDMEDDVPTWYRRLHEETYPEEHKAKKKKKQLSLKKLLNQKQ